MCFPQILRKPAPSQSRYVIAYRPFLWSELDFPLGISDEIVNSQTFEEDSYNEELTTQSTTPSDIDYALLESTRLKVSSEEEATDEDPDVIPTDDSFREETINIQSESMAQDDTLNIKQNMAGEERSIPLISITNTDDSIPVEVNKNPFQSSPEPLTDMEDLDHEPDQRHIRKLKIIINEDGALTDAEVMEASDDDNDVDSIPKISVQLNDIIDHSGTYEELVRMNSPKSKTTKSNVESRVSTCNTAQLGDFLKTFYEKDGNTDYEDVDLSDEEDNADEISESNENYDILQRLMDDGNVNISDIVKRSPIPSPSVTPEPGEKRNVKKSKVTKKGSSGLKKKSDSNLLSPRSLSPHLSDITDTEVVYSDSEEEEMVSQRPLSPQERRRRLKQSKENGPDKRKQRFDERSDILPELEISSVHISEKVPVKELVSESDTDNVNYVHYKRTTYAPKKKTLLMEVAGALMKETLVSTDVEHFEGSNESEDDAASQFSEDRYSGPENQYASIKDTEISKNALQLPKQDKVVLTDTEDIETEEESVKGTKASKPTIKILSADGSTEEDDFETTDNEYLSAVKEMRARALKDNNYEIHFIEVDGKTRPLAITPDLPGVSSSLYAHSQGISYLTDVEDLADSDIETTKTFLPVASTYLDAILTDTEMFEGEDETYRPKSPEPSDDENSQSLPEPVREMILMKEDPSGRPVSVVLPLGNVQPGGLKPPHLELEGGLSEVEDMVTDDDDYVNPPFVHDPTPTPDLSDVEGGIIHFSEVMKVQKKKLKVLGQDIQEPLTDTEDLFLSVSGKRKRSKPKLKLGFEPNQITIRQDLTDTEEIILSDNEGRHKHILPIPRAEIEPGTDLDDIDLSGEDDVHETQRHMAVTPDHLRELGDSYTALKEGSGPFSEEAKQSFLELHKIPKINTISPSPDIQFAINTDTEDMFTSADEEGFSRAETMTPYDGALELEDHSSVVYMKHTRKFDFDAPEEAMHIKGGIDIHETLTDVEDLGVSEDERPKPPEQLFVNDTADQVCVCLTTEVNDDDSVCVCVSKEHGGLSLVWNSKNSTDAKQQRGKNSVVLTSCSFLGLSSKLPCSSGKSRSWVPLINLISNRSLENPSQIKTMFSSEANKYILVEDQSNPNSFKFVLYIETRNAFNAFNGEFTFKLSTRVIPVGFVTDFVIYQQKTVPSNIAHFVVYFWKTIILSNGNNMSNETYFLVNNNVLKSSSEKYFLKNEEIKKAKKKVQDRAWSGSDILDTRKEFFEDNKTRSISVTKLIIRFECLATSNQTQSISLPDIDIQKDNSRSFTYDVDTSNETNNSEVPLNKLIRDGYDLKTNEKAQPILNHPKPDSTFKPIIPIVPLKDRSVSPRRLDPAPIRESPAFKALCERVQGTVENLTHSFHTNSNEDPKLSLMASYKMKKTFDFLRRSCCEKDLKNSSNLSGKIEVFETLSGSPKLKRKLILKSNSEAEIDTKVNALLSSAKSTSYSDITRSFTMLTLTTKTTSSNTISFTMDKSSQQSSSIRRTSSCPVSHWVRKGNN